MASMDVNRFEVGKYYKGINTDGTLIVFSIIHKGTDIDYDCVYVELKIELDRDTTHRRFAKGYECKLDNDCEPDGCFTDAKEMRNKSELLALII